MRSAADKGQLLAEMKNASLRLENERAYSHLNTAELKKTTANTYRTLSGDHVKIRGNIRNILYQSPIKIDLLQHRRSIFPVFRT